MPTTRLALLLIFTLPLHASGEEVFRSFHIGNSLTWDMQPLGFRNRPAPGYDSTDAGHHIRCARSLSYILANPEETCEDPNFGTFGEALPNQRWNAVTMQPYYGSSGGEITAAAAMINLARSHPENDDTRFYIYATWPRAGSFGAEPSIDFPATWLNTATEPLTEESDMRHRREWYEWFLGEVRDEVPDAEIQLIPVGEVFLALDAKFKAGAYEGIEEASDLYRDVRHANNVGRYVAHMTAWAVIQGRSPEQLTWTEGFSSRTPGVHNRDIPRTEELSQLIRSTVWEVVSTYEPTGLPEALAGDWNGDGQVNLADYTTWRDRGGSVDEYLVWRQNLAAAPSAARSAHAVPEPSAWLWAGAGGLFWLTRRRLQAL